MKTVKKYAFPVLLILTCGVVWYWQHALASLPYLPMNEVVPLGVLTPALFVLTFFTTFALLKKCDAARPVLRSFGSTAAMLVPVLMVGVFFLSFLTYRFAAAMPPVLRLPDWPTGIMTCLTAILCVCHLTGLLVYGLVKQNAGKKRRVAALLGWLLLNVCLCLLTA